MTQNSCYRTKIMAGAVYKFLLPLFFICVLSETWGQTYDTRHSIGINAGVTTGVGLSYIYWPNKGGFQLSFLPLYDKKNTNISLGATFLYKLREVNANYNFFLFAGNHYTNFTSSTNSYFYNVGIGPGIQYHKNGFAINFMIGYGILNIPNDVASRPTVELGGYYQF